jgi:hypothetical protein
VPPLANWKNCIYPPSRHFLFSLFLSSSRLRAESFLPSHGRPASLQCWLSSRCRAPPSSPLCLALLSSAPCFPVSMARPATPRTRRPLRTLPPWRPVACTVELQLRPAAMARHPCYLLPLVIRPALLLLSSQQQPAAPIPQQPHWPTPCSGNEADAPAAPCPGARRWLSFTVPCRRGAVALTP